MSAPRYCRRCRRELVEDVWRHGFDARTGDLRFTNVLRCPERAGYFSMSPHDMYLWARRLFRYTWVNADGD